MTRTERNAYVVVIAEMLWCVCVQVSMHAGSHRCVSSNYASCHDMPQSRELPNMLA
jgi:hypothetical protein